MKRARLLASAILATTFGASASQAGLLGDSINGYYNFPDFGTPYSGFSISPNSTFVVGAGSEGTAFIDGYPINVDFSDDALVLTMGSSVSFTGVNFNGIVFANLSDAFSNIVSVSGGSAFLDSGNSLLGVNFQGISFNQGDQIVVNFDTGAVPEPASWAMMIGGFAIAGAALRRRTTVAFA